MNDFNNWIVTFLKVWIMIRDTSPLLTVREVATRLRISLATAYLLIKQGDIACCRVGGRRGAIRVREDDIMSYLVESKVTVQSDELVKNMIPNQLKHLRLG